CYPATAYARRDSGLSCAIFSLQLQTWRKFILIQSSVTHKQLRALWLRLSIVVSLFAWLSCGGTGSMSNNTIGTPAQQENPATVSAVAICISTEPISSDFRHNEKHVPIPTDQVPVEISVDDILNWSGGDPGADDPRAGRELQVFHVAQAFVQFIRLVPN